MPCGVWPRGGTFLHPRLGALLAAVPAEASGPPHDLTECEVDVLRLIALGRTDTGIEERVFISVRTVESRRAHIRQKLGRSTRSAVMSS